ncbi:hypothetical protein [Ponticoccus alexandrii]|uniref:hypothetical protein n=1 Tax=Ponticoccus alexandrii TaxID=1943633 RepID=UPI0003D1B912|nr:hypothetical protein [Ponticoccus alexandrii]ETA51974.1 hypothetical protein P279_11280 [Rhodobacteraceae bacterium PD-2]
MPGARSVVEGVGAVWDMTFLALDPRHAHLMRFSTPHLSLGATLPERRCAEVFESGATILSTRGGGLSRTPDRA